MNNLIKHYLRVSREQLNILQGAFRMDNALDTLNKLNLAGRVPSNQVPELEAIVLHLRKINRLRNDIIHYGTLGDVRGEIVVSNEFYAYKNKNVVAHVVSTAILNAAQIDLAMILTRADLLLHPKVRSIPRNMAVLHEPWRYIPRSPAPPDQDSR